MIGKSIYKYAHWILECDLCGQHFVMWMVSDKDWNRGRKAIGSVLPGIIKPRSKVCKMCWEIFNPNPKYLSLDEYFDTYILKPNQGKAGLQSIRAILEEAWDLPSEKSIDEHHNGLKEWADSYLKRGGISI